VVLDAGDRLLVGGTGTDDRDERAAEPAARHPGVTSRSKPTLTTARNALSVT
jgi:hypothetical protein